MSTIAAKVVLEKLVKKYGEMLAKLGWREGRLWYVRRKARS